MITVIGSINMDIVCQTDVFPKQGETVLGNLFETVPGGKGANQAVAATRLGSKVKMVGAVGQDSFGPALIEILTNENMDVSSVQVAPTSTGIANILLFEQDNRIIVVPGANTYVTPQLVDKNEQAIKTSNLVVMQLEIPVETIEHTLKLCKKHGVPVLLNPAPARNFKPEWMEDITYLTPNETECELIFHEQIETSLQAYPNKLIVTLGDEGAMYHDGEKIVKVAGFRTTAVDTTGAGDTFNGAFAHKICEGAEVKEAVQFANAAASLSVEKFGAQGGMPASEPAEERMREAQS
ncbi:ribokinase [Lysinibacillus odysseyi]|uniref:Ribokinase n=1 Tax=Lysinibacillus odysseyi 34hs-1 = NBRC 100172 TaxID=1220589 RepID=A0A0A3IJX6_9BACI|nr:ribokinase [Lysinibacillus odysseyi]KGR85054.1 ribokinase [Lysinibacillus odysseyi 34hs-1 = NBRC 100172]